MILCLKMNLKRFLNFRNALIAFVCFTFIPIFIFLLIYNYWNLKNLIEFGKTTQTYKVEKYLWTDNNVNSIVSTLETISHLTVLKKQDVKEQDKKEVKQLFANILNNNKNLVNIVLLDKNGDVLFSPLPVKGKINASDRLYFKRVMATKKLSTGEFAISRTTGVPTIHFAMPILNENKEVISVIVVVPNIKNIITNFLNFDDNVYILDENGKIVSSKNNNDIGKVSDVHNFISHDKDAGSFIKNNFLISFANVKVNGKPIFTFVLKTPSDKYLYNIKKTFTIWLIVIIVFFVATVYTIIKFAEKFFYNPLKEIENAFSNFDIERAGQQINKNFYGEFNSLIKSFNKLSNLVKEEADLIIKEKHLWQSTFNESPDCMYIVDKEYKIIKANEQFLRTFDISHESLEALYCYNIVHNTSQAVTFCPHKEVLDNFTTITIEQFFPNLNRWFYTSISPLLDEGNNLLGTLHVLRDITSLKKSEEEKLKIEKQLLQTQKMESLGILAGGVAHDFNNILMSILGNTELALLKKEELPLDIVKKLETIKSVTEKAAHLTQQILAYSGKGKFIVKDIEINSFIRDIFDLIKVTLPKNATIHLNLDTTQQLICKVDPGQIQQVIMNLIINAGEALDNKEGLVTITTGKQWCDKQYFNETIDDIRNDLKEGYYVYFEVTDTGIGMDNETISKIFEPFFTTKFTGRGLGLSAMQGIIRGHHGAIKVYSELGKGTSFKIILPSIEKVETNGQKNKNIETKLNVDKYILLVDDEPFIIEVAKSMLEHMGLKVIIAENGRIALSTFKERHDEIAIVLLDLNIPELLGDEVFRELKKIDPNVKVILASGYNCQDVSQKLVGRGVAEFIQKPFNYITLKEKIENVLKKG